MTYPFSSANRTVNKNSINYSTKGGNITPTSRHNSTPSHGNNLSLWKIDMGKDAYFTVNIEGVGKPNIKHNKWGEFLPIKSMSYTPVSTDHLNFQVGIFSGLSIPMHRKMGKIDLEIQDTEDHYFENKFYEWYASTVPDDLGYVGYFGDFVKKLTYKEFNNKGQAIKTYYMEVMIDGDFKINRSYSNNDIKMFNVSLVIVGLITSTNAMHTEERISGTIVKYGYGEEL